MTFLGGGGPDLETMKVDTKASKDGRSRAVLEQTIKAGLEQGIYTPGRKEN